MKIEELRAKLNDLKAEVRSLNEANKVSEAEQKMEEVRNLKSQIKIQEELEEDEKRNLENQRNAKNIKEERGNTMGKVNEKRAMVKAVLGKEMTEEERAVIKTSDNAILYPEQYISEIEEIRKGFSPLKQLCDVIPVTKNSGKKPVIDFDQNSLADVAEGANIVEGSLVSTDITFDCDKYGLIDTLSSESVEDAEFEIEAIVKGNFTEIAVAKENSQIIKVIDDNAVEITGTDYEVLETTIDESVPAVKNKLITLVNQEAYSYLKNMKDKQGRNLGLITEQGGVEYFHSKPIYIFDSSLVTPSEGKTKIFYSLAMKEAVKFFDRKGLSIAKSTEAGFSNDTIKIRVLERFDVAKGSVRSIKKLEL